MPDPGDTQIDPAIEDRPAASRAGLVPALTLIAVVLGATVFAIVWALNGGGDRSERHTYVIPADASERIANGEEVEIMPAVVRFEVGDYLILRNDADRVFTVGPYTVRPGETLEQQYLRPQTLIGECDLSTTGEIRIVVT